MNEHLDAEAAIPTLDSMSHIFFWGFQTELSRLYHSAVIWQQIRTLRLVRLRQAKQGLDTTSLATLPTEIMSIIEDELLDLQEPFDSFECPVYEECLCGVMDIHKEFLELRSTREAWIAWCLLNEDIEDPDDFQDEGRVALWWDNFRNSEYHNNLFAEYRDVHPDICPGLTAFYPFWREVAACASKAEHDSRHYDPFNKTQEVIAAIEIIRIFLTEHGLERVPLDDDRYSLDNTLIALMYSARAVYGELPPPDLALESSTFGHVSNIIKHFSFHRPFGSALDVKWPPSKLRYLVVNAEIGHLYTKEELRKLGVEGNKGDSEDEKDDEESESNPGSD